MSKDFGAYFGGRLGMGWRTGGKDKMASLNAK